jgi:subtilisin
VAKRTGVDRYILLPPAGVRGWGPEAAALRDLHAARSTRRPRAAMLMWRPGQARDGLFLSAGVHAPPSDGMDAVPLKVVDSIHEDGPKLVELSDQDVRRLHETVPVMRVEPNRDYTPQGAPGTLPVQLPPGGTNESAVCLRIRAGDTGGAVDGATVTALVDRTLKLGDRGVSDAQGEVKLRLGPAPVQVEELRVDPPRSGYWGASCKQVTVGPCFDVNLEPVDLSKPDVVRHFHGSPAHGRDGTGVTVGVIDTGVDLSHPDLVVTGGANTVTGEPADDYDDNGLGHGTQVAGIIAAKGTPPAGLSGIAPKTELRSYRVYAKGESVAKTYAILKALIYAVDDGCDLINLSLGAVPTDDVLREAIDDANDSGTVVIGAAGNDHRQAVSVPACYAVAVSALGRVGTYPAGALEALDEAEPCGSDPADFVAGFSNFGQDVDFIAPGVGVVSTVPGGHSPGRGTSMAAAVATGMAARLLSSQPVLLSAHADARAASIRNYLGGVAKTMGFGLDYEGYGRLA